MEVPEKIQRRRRPSGRSVNPVSFPSRIATEAMDAVINIGENIVTWWDGRTFSGFVSGILAISLNFLIIAARLGMIHADSEEFWSYNSEELPVNERLRVAKIWYLVLWFISLANTVKMFFSFKTYQLFRQPTKSSSGKKHDRSWIIKSPNAKIVTLDMQGDAGEDEDVSQDLQEEQSRYNSNAPIYKKVLMTTFGRLRSLISCIFAIGQPQPSKSRKVWQLKVWHPSPGTTTLFTWYSPLSLMAIHNIGGKDYPYWIALSICCSLMLSFTIERFQDLVRDREILAGQVLKEYSQEIYSIENFPPESQVVLITDRRQSQAQAYRRPAPAESQAAIQARLYAQRMEKASVGAKVGRRDGGEYSDEEESGDEVQEEIPEEIRLRSLHDWLSTTVQHKQWAEVENNENMAPVSPARRSR